MALKRMDNIGIVVEDLRAMVDFFRELGLQLEGQGMIEGEWAGGVTGLGDHRNAPVNALGYLRVMFTVEDIDDTLERLQKRGARLVGEVVQYLDVYRLCYIRGPEDVLIGLAEEVSASHKA
jgi:catechol 2,3-dioxygenase-like lactoylglutathione lyase family enzyme